MPAGIVAWGTYLPYWRLDRKAIGLALGTPAGRGTRTVASYDEDTTTIAVEAARRLLAMTDVTPETLLFSTPDPGYLDKTNATTIHAALALPAHTSAYDFNGSARSAWGALAAGLNFTHPTMVAIADIRTGLPGGADERESGDAAAAFLGGTEGAVATVIGHASTSVEFLDRWRTPGDSYSKQWEERFGEDVYVPAAEAAFTDALKAAGITKDEIDHVVVAGLHARSVKAITGRLNLKVAPTDLSQAAGNLGAAHFGVCLAHVLETASPNQVIAVLNLADGADAAILRTTDALTDAQRRQGATVQSQLDNGRADLSYASFLTWRGQLHREPPRRPDPERPGAPAMHRSDEWKYGFSASRCLQCGFRHLPPTRVCLNCKTIDEMEFERMADIKGTVATFTIDRLAFSLSPPVIGVIVDFDGGGRFRCEMTDADPDAVQIGTRVEMTFRRVYTADGVHNYFWKARPVLTKETA